MTVETFFANFGHLADAPNGVQKLRELILQLAVQGKLVPYDANDEHASVLLKKIKVRKEQLIKEKKVRKTKIPMAYVGDEQVALPPSWMYTTLYDAGDIGPRNDFNDKVEASFVPMPLISQKYGISVQSDVKKWGEIKSGFTHFAEGDVCLAKITPCFQNGKSAVMRGLKNRLGSGTTELHVFRPVDEMVCSEYVLIFLKSPLFIDEGISRMTGSAGQKRITRDYFAGKPFPLPPLKEQKRIVAKVDQLMALCNELEDRQQKQQQGRVSLNNSALNALLTAREPDEFAGHWQRISTNFDLLYDHPETIGKLRAAILQLAVQGKLVPQDLNDEPASVLLERIKAEKERLVKEGKIKKQKKLPAINADEKPFVLPSGWEWSRVWDVAELITSGSRDWAKHYSETGAIFVTMGNLSRGHYKLRMNTVRYVNPPKGGEGSRTKLVENDLLISITGDVGNLGLIPKGFGDAYINQHTCLLRFMPECQSRYFPEVMRSPLAKFQYDVPQRGIKNSFRLGDVGEMIIPIPPLEEQKRIVAKVDQLMTLCDELYAKLNQAQQHSGKLMEATVWQLLVA